MKIILTAILLLSSTCFAQNKVDSAPGKRGTGFASIAIGGMISYSARKNEKEMITGAIFMFIGTALVSGPTNVQSPEYPISSLELQKMNRATKAQIAMSDITTSDYQILIESSFLECSNCSETEKAVLYAKMFQEALTKGERAQLEAFGRKNSIFMENLVANIAAIKK